MVSHQPSSSQSQLIASQEYERFIEFSFDERSINMSMLSVRYFVFFQLSKVGLPLGKYNITSHITSHPCLVISLNRDSSGVKESEQAERKRNIKLYGFLLRSNCQIMTMKSIFYTRDLSPFLVFFSFSPATTTKNQNSVEKSVEEKYHQQIYTSFFH